MRILLINPLNERLMPGRPIWTPLSVAYAAAVLEQAGCQVQVFDRLAAFQRGRGLAELNRDMQTALTGLEPDLVLIESIPWSISDTCLAARKVRRIYKGRLGLFGCHVSALPELSLHKVPEVDLVIAGEAEGPLRALAGGAWLKAPGVWLRQEGGVRSPAEPAGQVDLDSLPLPAFHLLDLGYYAKRSLTTIWGHYLSSLTLMTSRGCRHQCHFCLESRAYSPGLRFRSLERVLEDVQQTLARYPVDAIYFGDCDFLARPQRCEEFCRRMINLGLHRRIEWAVQARADALEPALLKTMKKAGCTLIELGVESGSQRLLGELGKDLSSQTSCRAVRLCRRAGIHTHAYLLVGLPGETLADLNKTLAWVRDCRPSHFFFNWLMVLPGTPLYKHLGDSFFERASWDDRQALHAYLRRDFSAVDPGQRREWVQKHSRPLQKRLRLSCILRANPPWRLARLLAAKLSGGLSTRS